MALRVSVHVSLWLCELEERHREAFLHAATNPEKETPLTVFKQTFSVDTQGAHR